MREAFDFEYSDGSVEPVIQTIEPVSLPVQTIEPVDAFNTSLPSPVAPTAVSIEVPEPTVSYPSNWEYAAAASEPVQYESDLPWHSVPAETPSQDPVFVFSKGDELPAEAPTNYPVELQPAYTYQPPSYIPPVYEVPNMEYKEDPTPEYVRGIDMMPVYDVGLTYEQKYPIESPPWNPGPIYDEPIPILDGPIYTAAPLPPIDIPVSTPPPVVTVNVGGQTPTTQQAAAGSADGETALFFGLPWYYVAGAAAVALLAFSSSDGKN